MANLVIISISLLPQSFHDSYHCVLQLQLFIMQVNFSSGGKPALVEVYTGETMSTYMISKGACCRNAFQTNFVVSFQTKMVNATKLLPLYCNLD